MLQTGRLSFWRWMKGHRQTVLQFLQPDEFAEIFQVLGLEDRKLVVTGLDNNYVSEIERGSEWLTLLNGR